MNPLLIRCPHHTFSMPIYTEISLNNDHRCPHCKDRIDKGMVCVVTNQLSIDSRKWHPHCWIQSAAAMTHCCYDYYGRRGSKHKLIRRYSHIGYTFDRLWGMDWMEPALAVRWKHNIVHSWKANVPPELHHLLHQHRVKMAKVPLQKHIREMTAPEIRDELRRRKLRASTKENKSVLHDRLTRWFQNRWCRDVQRERTDKVITAYCRRHSKTYGEQIPIVLQAMFKQYACSVI